METEMATLKQVIDAIKACYSEHDLETLSIHYEGRSHVDEDGVRWFEITTSDSTGYTAWSTIDERGECVTYDGQTLHEEDRIAFFETGEYDDTEKGVLSCLVDNAMPELVTAAAKAVEDGTHTWTRDPSGAPVWALVRRGGYADRPVADLVVYPLEADFDFSGDLPLPED